MNNKKHVLLALCALVTGVGFSQQQTDSTQVEQLEEVVITDSRFTLKRENSGKTVVKITAKEIEQHAGETLSQLINTKSGISINGSNSQAGQNLGTYVRGGQNRQVLVLIDGIALSDPSQIENNFDLQLLDLNQIESIEILKGASSALYGNRASTAVINITLKSASKQAINANFSSFLGTNNSQNDSDLAINDFTNSVGVNGTIEKFSYLANFSNTFTDGLSAIKAAEGNTKYNSDEYSKINGYLKLNYKFSNAFELTAFGNFDKYNTEYDGGFGFIDENNLSLNKQYRVGVAPKFNYNKGSVTANAAYNTIDREFRSDFPGKFEANSIVIDAFNKYRLSDKLLSVVGVNYVKTEMTNETIPFGSSAFTTSINPETANDNILDPYVNLTYISDFGFNANVGARLNNHSEYGSNFVYNINPSYVFKMNNNSLKVLASYSTAYITPSLYQLFAPGFGNANLQAQEDSTIEGGFEFNLAENFRVSSIYFNRKQKQFIDYVTTDFVTFEGEYQNLEDDFTVQGVEVELGYSPLTKLDFNANYTFTERKDGVIFRVPKHKINASIDYQFCERTFASLSYQFSSERTSPFLNDDFTANRTLESFSLVNFNISHSVLNNKIKLFAGVSNVFNEDYEELYRFSTKGRNYRIGFNLTL
ncbi:TonB-dependent receptor plug domain-containing protein [Lacinutrix salivirga]